MGDRIIQRVMIPPPGRKSLAALYCRLDHTSTNEGRKPQKRSRRAMTLPRGTILRTDTWFNAFFENHWREHTHLQQLVLQVRVSGAGCLRLYRRSSKNGQILLREIDFAGRNQELRVEIASAPVTPGSSGILFFEIEARSSVVRMHRAEWVARQVVTKPSRLVAGLCTFNRASQLLRNITALLVDPEVAEVLERILVVDQGREKVRDHPRYAAVAAAAGDRLQLFEQDNFGGAGGFTRCLLEARYEQAATHVLLMDDDISVEPESVLRAAAFLSLARGDFALGGHMLDLFRPRQLLESGSCYFPERLRIDEPSRCRVDRPDDLTPFEKERRRHYNGWWFFALPLSVLERAGLPLPLFLRGDDVEFGCRLLRSGVPTVSLPGVAVWHEPFEGKGRGWHAFYELRNLFLVGALHFPRGKSATVARTFISRLLDELLAYDYYESWLLCEAAAAYLRGPNGLRHPPSATHQRLLQARDILAPATQPREHVLPVARAPRPRLTPRAARMRRLAQVLRNLLRPSPTADAKALHALQSGGEQWFDVAGADVVAIDEPHREELVILRRSRSRFVRLLLRGLWLSLRLLVSHRRTVRNWRTGVVPLMTRQFWKDYLRPAAGVARAEAPLDRDLDRSLGSASRSTEVVSLP